MPIEARDVGSAKPQFALTLHQMHAVFEIACHELLHDGGCSVRTSVVDDQDVKPMFFQPRDCTEDGFDIFFFVVGGDDYNGIVLLHCGNLYDVFYSAKVAFAPRFAKLSTDIF